MSKEKLSRGEAKHRRRVLAEERGRVEYIRRQITGNEQLERELDLIKVELKYGVEIREGIDPFYRELRSFEKDWIEYRLGKIDGSERQSRFDRRLNRLEKESPEIYKKLITPNEEGEIPLAELRNRHSPPKR
jgi:hypothetical protein